MIAMPMARAGAVVVSDGDGIQIIIGGGTEVTQLPRWIMHDRVSRGLGVLLRVRKLGMF